MIIWDKEFEMMMSRKQIAERISVLGRQISADYAGRSPILLGVLNGAFMFTSDLAKEIDLQVEITFLRLSSYRGMSSGGKVVNVLGFPESLKGRDVIIVEDIIDTGLTINHLIAQIIEHSPASVRIAAFLTKPEAMRVPVMIDYVGFEIADRFVLGYGLDYNGRGRNYPDLYVLKA